MRQKSLVCAAFLSLVFITSICASPPYSRTLWGTEFPDAVLKDAIGMVSIWCFNEGMAPADSKPETLASFEQAQKEEKTIDCYKIVSGRFQLASLLSVGQFVPIYSESREGVLRCVPATKKQGEFVEIVYDVEKNLRSWVRLTGEASEGCQIEFLSLIEDGPIAMRVDIDILIEGKHVKLYKSPNMKAESVDISYDYICSHAPSDMKAWSLITLSELKNGFGLLTVEECDSDKLGFIGWIPLRDSQGRLQVWPCYWCCGCC